MDKAERLAVAVRATVARIRFAEAREQGLETAHLGVEVVESAQALAHAWKDGAPDVLDWIGCREDEYRAAVDAALAE